MGDLAEDTEVTGGDGSYRGRLSRDWEIWGPMGGYTASVALRAAGAHTQFPRVASFYCQFLGVPAFGDVDVTVETTRRGRTAEALDVTLSQDGSPRLRAMVWTVADDLPGLEHDHPEPPAVPGPDQMPTLAELRPDEWPWYPFWANLEARPTRWSDEWPPPERWSPTFQEWFRFVPESTFDDPWVDACRTLVLVDVVSWPAANAHHATVEPPPFFAPSMDLHVVFHRQRPDVEWLLADGYAPVAEAGAIGFDGRLWSIDGELLASGGGQLLCRPRPVD